MYSGASTGGSIENNELEYLYDSTTRSGCSVPAASASGIEVDSAATSGTTLDYNIVALTESAADSAYDWSGTLYGNAGALFGATTEGQHDVNPTTIASTASAAISSANSSAPGELATDIYQDQRVNDPNVADTGSGTYADYDRGAYQAQGTLTVGSLAASASQAPVGGAVAFTVTATDSWSNPIYYEFVFSDGTRIASSTGTVSRTFSSQGTYTARVYVLHSPNGYPALSNSLSVSVVAPDSLTPGLALNFTQGLGVSASGSSTTDAWNITGYSYDFGDGSAGSGAAATHVYTKPGTYPVTLTVTDAGGNTATVTKSYDTGSYFTAVSPSRILDTRNGTGVSSAGKVPANGTVRLKVAGVGSIPATGVTAVVMNVTVTNPSRAGYITTYPDGTTKPTTSNVNFASGQTIPNVVVVQVGGDGYVDLANTSSGSTNLIADVAGYYSHTASSGFNAITPARVLDTRTTATLAAGATVRVDLGPYTGITAAALNVTVTNPTRAGFITAYPDGVTLPTASNVNYAAGQTTANETVVQAGSDGYVDFTNTSTGSVNLIVDLTGYFTPGAGNTFTPVAPVRVLDTRDVAGAPSPVYAGWTEPVWMAGELGLPVIETGAVAANVTVTDAAANGFVTVYPAGGSLPDSSLLNFGAGETKANATMAGISQGGFDLYNASTGSIDLVVDVFGYYD